MKSKILVFLVCSIFLPVILFAATTGKIVGTVVDKETGDLLPGANILITGTQMGAATDIYGKFIVLSVPVGTYTLQASFMGYNTVTFENIRVNADLTTTVDFQLTPTAIMGEAVTIVAEKPLVQTSATNVTRIQSFEEFKNIPARSVTAIVQMQPGVTTRDGQIYIRGGRREEIGYYLEGAATRDVLDGSNRARIIPDAIEEIQLQAGGYDAEFGGANAGIIRQTLRSGGPTYKFSVQAETDNFADNGKKFLDTYSYGYSDYTVTASGPLPILNNKVKFFVAGQNTYWADRVVRFWKGFDFYHSDEINVEENKFPMVTTNFADTIKQGLHMVDGNMPEMGQNTYIGTGTLVYDAHPIRLRFSANLSYSKWISGSNGYVGILNLDRNQVNMNSDGLYTLKATHILNPKTYYEVNLNYFDFRQKNYDPIFKDNYWAYWDSTANAAEGITYKKWSSANVGNTVDIYGFNFTTPGTPGSWDLAKRSYLGGSFTFTSQLKQHEFRFGGEYKRWTVRNFGINESNAFTTRLNNPDIYNGALAGDPEDYGQWLALININNYGYDLWGNEIDKDEFGLDGPKHPTFFSAFIQDKFEAKQLVIRAGVRLDGFNNDDFTFEDPRNPAWDRALHILDVDQINKSKTKYYVSPRVGLAFPATERTVFHVQYGKFIQEPRMDDIYTGQRAYDQRFLGGFYFQGIGFGLDPQRTTQYEIGFNQQFAENASFDITAFYKDIQGWITTGRIVGGPTDEISYYNILQNGAFSTNKGVEFSLTLRRTNRMAGQINYTYSSSLGTASASASTIAGTEQGTQTPTIISPLDFHRPHVGSINFDYRFGEDDGGMILEKTGLNVLFQFASGHPYTLRSGAFGQQDEQIGGEISDTRNRNPLEAVNSSMTPWNMTLDLRLDKTVNLGPMAANFYVYVQNLTNRRNVRNVYMRTGNPWDDGFRADYETSGPIAASHGGDIFWSLYDALNLSGNGSNSQSGQLFERPREIRVGLRLEY